MPLIARAERVIILCAAEDGTDEDPSGRRLQRALQWRNPNVSLQYLAKGSRSAAETLLKAVTDEEGPASLLVMRGYGHTRFREAVFGGVTRHVLGKAEIAVLMSH